MNQSTLQTALQLTPQQLLPAPASPNQDLDPDDVQGDVLVGLQKNYEIFYFFQIAGDPNAFKKSLRRDVSKRITSTRLAIAREFQLLAYKQEKLAAAATPPSVAPVASAASSSAAPTVAISEVAPSPVDADPDLSANQKQPDDGSEIPLVGINIAFSNFGMKKLRPNEDLGEAAFTAGALGSATKVGDSTGNASPVSWAAEFISNEIDGVFIVTGNTIADAQAALDSVLGPLGATTQLVKRIDGKVRERENRGHEHFGFADGISQPSLQSLGTAYPGQSQANISSLVLGIDNQPISQPWMKNGSFMVFRQLQQLVPEWNTFLNTHAADVGLGPDELGARLMGRWKSGAPIATSPTDDPMLGGDATKNNNFSAADLQRVCPGAHIATINPRGGGPFIMRAGIPFGDDVSPQELSANATDPTNGIRGLLFVCYQSSIQNQFEFLQATWANNGLSGGPDPIIGQSANPRTTQVSPTRSVTQATQTVRALGMGYFFVPSITALICELSDAV